MEYNNLYNLFVNLFPDEKTEFDRLEKEALIDNTDGEHVKFGMVVVPFTVQLIEGNKESDVHKAFAFFESMAASKDAKICEVLEFTVLEDFISRGIIFLKRCYPYMGPETLSCCKSVEQYMMADN